MNQVEKVKIKLPLFSFEGEFRNTVTYHSRLLRVVKQIIDRGCSAKHCEQIYKVNRSWDKVLNNSYRVYQTCSILSALIRLKYFRTKGLSGALWTRKFCFILSHWYFYTANIYIFFTLERQWNVAKSTFINCKFRNIFEFLFTLDKCSNYNISMYFKNTMKKL